MLSAVSVAFVSLVFPLPWLAAPLATIRGDALAAGLAGVAIALQLALRIVCRHYLRLPVARWTWGGVGGALFVAMAIASVVKTETGWRWTWRGRPLARR